MSSYRSIHDKSDLEAIHRSGVGFVIDPFNRRLHHASCPGVLRLGLSDKKWFAEDERGRDQYLAWRSGFTERSR